MRRRTLLGLGAAGALGLAIVGGGVAAMHEAAWRDGRLLPAGRLVLAGVANAVLDGSLPDEAPARSAAMDAHMQRLQSLLQTLPGHAQREVGDLLALLAMPPGRRVLAGLSAHWLSAPTAQVQAALQSMRVSRWMLRRQAYGALRDLTHAAFYADASAWPLLGYPGPRALA
jgi:hypothetical protein